MKSKGYLKDAVIKVRKEGFSISQIAVDFKLSKGTVSLWCKNVKISQKAKDAIYQKWFLATNKGRAKGTQSNKNKRLKDLELQNSEAKKIVGTISERDIFILGLALYWAEGGKKGDSTGFSFINSDPRMIKIMLVWLTKYMNISQGNINFRVSVNIAHRERIGNILKFWSNLLDLPISKFGKTLYIRTAYKRVYTNHCVYNGMLRIRVSKSVWLRRRIVSMIDEIVERMPA